MHDSERVCICQGLDISVSSQGLSACSGKSCSRILPLNPCHGAFLSGSAKKPSCLQLEIPDNLCSLGSNSSAGAEEVLLHMDGISPWDPARCSMLTPPWEAALPLLLRPRGHEGQGLESDFSWS